MVPSAKQRFGGCLIALLGALGTADVWYNAVHDGLFFEKASFLFPVFFVVGIAGLFFQGYKEERLARGEDISELRGWKLLTTRWRVVFVLSLVLGFGNYLILLLSFNWSE
jgi:hypothetical protein